MKNVNNNTILVTGADGLVGSAIKNLNPKNVVYLDHGDVDLTDFNKTRDKFTEIEPDQVIHLAARVGGIGANSKHPGEFFRNNILININVLECARLVKVKKLISFMSTCIFPNKIEFPLNVKSLHDGPPHPSNFGYAYAKRMLDIQSRAYRQEYGSNFITAIPTNIFGPNDNFDIEDGHVLPSLIHKCFLAKKDNTPLIIWGSGTPLREFIYSEDVAKLAFLAMENYNDAEPIIFSPGLESSIKEMVEIITEKLNFTGEIIYDSTKPDGQLRKQSDTKALHELYPDFKFTPLKDGINKTIDWFLANYPDIRK
jgi:GDP-L-fucose synthase